MDGRHGGQRGGVDANAVALHARENGSERQVDVFVKPSEILRFDFAREAAAPGAAGDRRARPAAPERATFRWRRTTSAKVVLRGGGPQQKGIEHGGVTDAAQGAGAEAR